MCERFDPFWVIFRENFPGNRETGKQHFWFCKGNRETALAANRETRETVSLLLFFPKNTPKMVLEHQFLENLLFFSQCSRKIENVRKMNVKWMFTSDFGKTYFQKVKKSKKLNLIWEKKKEGNNEGNRETVSLGNRETAVLKIRGKQGNRETAILTIGGKQGNTSFPQNLEHWVEDGTVRLILTSPR